MAARKEVEIKFVVDDVRALLRKLRHAGFRQVTPRTHEVNTLYDTPQQTLRRRRELLRIRKYGERWILTHKAPSASAPATNSGQVVGAPGRSARHKSRLETETEVANGEQLAHILQALGFVPSFRYEKFRSEWTDGKGHVVVDETPIGNISEIEGPARWIDATAKKLGVARERYLTQNYAQMFLAWKSRTGSTAEEMTFKAVEGKNRVIR